MPKPIFEPVRINLTEQREWKKYFDPSEWKYDPFQDAMESLESLEKDDIAALAEYVLEVGKKKRVILSDEEKEAIWEAYRGGEEIIGPFRQIIQDAAVWDHEQALMPRDSDIEWATELAIDHIVKSGEWWGSADENVRELIPKLGYKAHPPSGMGAEAQFIQDFLEGAVTLEHEPGHYDRFLIYNPPSKSFMDRLGDVDWIPERGYLDWTPSRNLLRDKTMVSSLRELAKNLKIDIVDYVLHYLEKTMHSEDLSNRLDFGKQWTAMLKDKSMVKPAQEALKKVVK